MGANMRRMTSSKEKREQVEQQPAIPELPKAAQIRREEAVRKRLQSLRFLLEGGLKRLEDIIQAQDPLTDDRQVQSLEIDDTRDYFLKKLRNIRSNLQHMAEQLDLSAALPETREILHLELLALLVLVEGSRAPQIAAGDGEFDRKVREVLRNTIEDVALDLLNLRARVK